MSDNNVFEGWCILELMGHRRLGGYVTEQEIAGAAFLRIDVPSPDGEGMRATQFYAPAAVYAITPTTEEIARGLAEHYQPEPVHRWEFPALQAETVPARNPSYFDGVDDIDDFDGGPM